MNKYIESNKDRFLSELLELLRIPSVSADSKFKGDVLKAAEFVHAKLVEAGADVAEICSTAGHPIVYGEKIVDPMVTMMFSLPIPMNFGIHLPSNQ
jgi:acetylornithine deacetylase/succinyl-diaminopimelate desuccinylase-like protein